MRFQTVSSQRGFTITESLMALFITSISAAAVIPDFIGISSRHSLQSAASQIETEIQLARSEAVARNRTVRFVVDSRPGRACYTIHTGSRGDCECNADGTTTCTGGAVPVRSANFAQYQGIQIAASSRDIGIDGSRGTITPTTTIRLAGQDGTTVNVVVNIMGRVRTCVASGRISGLVNC
jgi:type IV fimbrial biogenesis protein FimT